MPRVAVDLVHHGHDLVGAGRIQIAGGLVAEDHLGLVHQGAGDGHPLLLPAGELVGAMALPVGEADVSQGGFGRLSGYRPLLACVLGGQHDVLDGREAGHQVEGLKDEAHLGRGGAG